MAPRKLRKHQAGTAVTALASAAPPAGASTASHAAAAAFIACPMLLEVSDTVDNC